MTAKQLYRRMRRDRSYLPTWGALTSRQQQHVIRLAAFLTKQEQETTRRVEMVAGEIYRGSK